MTLIFKRYDERIRQCQQMRLFETNQRQFYKQINQLDQSERPMLDEEKNGEKLCKCK